MKKFAPQINDERDRSETTSKAAAFELWMQALMPMVTLFKTFDVSQIVKVCRQRQWKFNMLMCWGIGKAATTVDEFYMLPVGDKLMQFEGWPSM